VHVCLCVLGSTIIIIIIEIVLKAHKLLLSRLLGLLVSVSCSVLSDGCV